MHPWSILIWAEESSLAFARGCNYVHTAKDGLPFRQHNIHRQQTSAHGRRRKALSMLLCRVARQIEIPTDTQGAVTVSTRRSRMVETKNLHHLTEKGWSMAARVPWNFWRVNRSLSLSWMYPVWNRTEAYDDRGHHWCMKVNNAHPRGWARIVDLPTMMGKWTKYRVLQLKKMDIGIRNGEQEQQRTRAKRLEKIHNDYQANDL